MGNGRHPAKHSDYGFQTGRGLDPKQQAMMIRRATALGQMSGVPYCSGYY